MFYNCLIIFISLISIILSQEQWTSDIEEKQQFENLYIENKSEENVCYLNDDYWRIIKWYFGKTHHITVTEISENVKEHSIFADDIFINFFNEIQLTFTSHIIDYNYNLPNLTYADTFSWRGIPFLPREKPHIVNETIQNSNNGTKNIWNKRKKRKTMMVPIQQHSQNAALISQNNEPELGVFLFAKSINIIDKYLTGAPRDPFYVPRSNFIIVISNELDNTDWQLIAGNVMEKLWKDYGILNSILITTCNPDGLIGYFDPFAKKYQFTNITEEKEMLKQKENYGIFKFKHLSDDELNSGLLLEKSRNFHGYPMTITFFERYPTFLKLKDLPKNLFRTYFANELKNSNGYGGFDALVMTNMAKTLNFQINSEMQPDQFGYILDNGNYTGTLGDVIYHKADVSFNARFLTYYNTSEIEFLFPVYADKFCIITPKSKKIPQWKAIFKCFNSYVWGYLILMNSFCGCFWYLLKIWALKRYQMYKNENNLRINNKRNFLYENKMVDNDHIHINTASIKKLQTHNTFSVVSLEMWRIMLAGPTMMPFRTLERLFMCSCLIANIIIIGTFQGSLTTSFSTISYYKDIDTFVELDKSGLPIYASSKSLNNLFGVGNKTPLMESLNSKFFIVSNVLAKDGAAYERNMCAIERYSDIRIYISTKYELPDGSVLLHTMKQCPRVYYLSYIVGKGWPFRPRFSGTLQRFFEAGLLKRWYQEIEDSFILDVRINRRHEINTLDAFTLIDMQTAFYILGIGLIICLITFLAELFVMGRKRRRRRKQIIRN